MQKKTHFDIFEQFHVEPHLKRILVKFVTLRACMITKTQERCQRHEAYVENHPNVLPALANYRLFFFETPRI